MKYNLEQYINDIIADAKLLLPNIITAINNEITDGYNLTAVTNEAYIYRRDNPSREALRAFFFYDNFDQIQNIEDGQYNQNLPYQIDIGIGYLNNATASHLPKLLVLLRYREALLELLQQIYSRCKIRGYGAPKLLSLATLTDNNTDDKVMEVRATIELNIGR